MFVGAFLFQTFQNSYHLCIAGKWFRNCPCNHTWKPDCRLAPSLSSARAVSRSERQCSVPRVYHVTNKRILIESTASTFSLMVTPGLSGWEVCLLVISGNRKFCTASMRPKKWDVTNRNTATPNYFTKPLIPVIFRRFQRISEELFSPSFINFTTGQTSFRFVMARNYWGFQLQMTPELCHIKCDSPKNMRKTGMQ